MSIRTKDELRIEWANGNIITQPVAYDLIDTAYAGLCAADISYSCFGTVNELSANWESCFSTVCSLSSPTTVPISFSAVGSMGNWSYDSTTFYFCVSNSLWVKWAISRVW
jgi:hypothetical protein